MSARIDQEVKRHLDAMHRDLLTSEGAAAPVPRGTRALEYSDSSLFTTGEVESDFEQEEILQPRRLSLRVF